MKEMFGTNQVYKLADVAEYLKPLVINAVTDAIGESKISALDLAANYKEFGQTVIKCSEEDFNKIGLKITNFVIENLSLPEEVEKALDERTKLGVFEDKMGTYTQKKAADALEAAAKNPSGNNLAGLGMGLTAGATVGSVYANNLNMQNTPRVENKPRENAEGKVCTKCGAKMSAGAKFCPECGKKLD